MAPRAGVDLLTPVTPLFPPSAPPHRPPCQPRAGVRHSALLSSCFKNAPHSRPWLTPGRGLCSGSIRDAFRHDLRLHQHERLELFNVGASSSGTLPASGLLPAAPGGEATTGIRCSTAPTSATVCPEWTSTPVSISRVFRAGTFWSPTCVECHSSSSLLRSRKSRWIRSPDTRSAPRQHVCHTP